MTPVGGKPAGQAAAKARLQGCFLARIASNFRQNAADAGSGPVSRALHPPACHRAPARIQACFGRPRTIRKPRGLQRLPARGMGHEGGIALALRLRRAADARQSRRATRAGMCRSLAIGHRQIGGPQKQRSIPRPRDVFKGPPPPHVPRSGDGPRSSSRLRASRFRHVPACRSPPSGSNRNAASRRCPNSRRAGHPRRRGGVGDMRRPRHRSPRGHSAAPISAGNRPRTPGPTLETPAARATAGAGVDRGPVEGRGFGIEADGSRPAQNQHLEDIDSAASS